MPDRTAKEKSDAVRCLDAAIDRNKATWGRYRKQFQLLSKDPAKNDDPRIHREILKNVSFPCTLSFRYMGATHEEDEGKTREDIAPVDWDRKARRTMLVAVDTRQKMRKYYSYDLIYELKMK